MKVLIIGIDGLSPVLIDRWIDDLPNFREIKTNGFLGLSIPPIPAQTPVAWTTFMTGKNPGRHSIFSFMMRKEGTYERQIAQPQMIKSKTLWRLLGEKKKRVGIVNVPMSDIEQIEGPIIPGFLSSTEGIPHPKSLKDALKKNFGVETLRGDVEAEILQNVEKEPFKFFECVNQITDETTQISHFVAKEDMDLFMTVFMGTDRIQHFFWRHIDPTHPEYEENSFTQRIKEYYVRLDGIVGSFLKIADEETITMVLSDHGFCSVNKELVINNYLEQTSFLKTKNDRVDLENSKAVSYGYGDIWLNVKNREPNGKIRQGEEYEETRNVIIESLRQLKVDGESPIKDVRKREDIYWGNYLGSGPDLMVIFNVGWQAARRPEIMKKQASERYVNENPRWSGGHDGTHDPHDVPGVLGLISHGTIDFKTPAVNLWDLAPTILKLMNIQIPPDMDGKPLLS